MLKILAFYLLVKKRFTKIEVKRDRYVDAKSFRFQKKTES